MAAIFSTNPNINFTMNLRQDGFVIAETGIYDADAIESGILFYNTRVVGSTANFRLCI